MKTRKQIARDEITRDPIFLFQYKRHSMTNFDDCRIHIDKEGNAFRKDDECEVTGEMLSWSDLEDMECAMHYWDTELVFLTREEGEAYGKSRAYNYPDGWRVYCVCAVGTLKKMLEEFDSAKSTG